MDRLPRTSPVPQRDSEGVFSRHLDLATLRGRRCGLVRCPFHNDQRPSLSVDLDRGVWHCFGCGVGGGVKRFAELVGESAERADTPRSGSRRSPLDEARAQVLAAARRQAWAREGVRDLYAVADFVCRRLRAADQARRLGMTLGPSEQVWDALALAAGLETDALAVESQVDAILAGGRLT